MENAQSGLQRLVGLECSEHLKDIEFCLALLLPGSLQIKAELLGLIEDKFNVLTTKIDDKLSQISQSASYTESLCSMNTDLLSICSGKSAAGSEGSKGFQMVSSKDLVERKTGESGSW